MKKSGWKKKYVTILIICVILILLLLMGYILRNKLSLKERLFQNGEIRSGEYVDDMGSREGVSFHNCLVEMIYYKKVDGGVITNSLHVFSNGEIYSVDYFEEKGTISACWELWQIRMTDIGIALNINNTGDSCQKKNWSS